MPSILGVIPEHIRRLMPASERQAMGKAAWTMPELTARQAVRLERELQDQIAGYLRLKEVTFGLSRMDRKTTYTVGWPDFSFVLNGRACFLEAKLPGKEPTDEQWEIIGALTAAGAFVRVVYSLAEAVEAFREAEGLPKG
jgi:hypothetical protein